MAAHHQDTPLLRAKAGPDISTRNSNHPIFSSDLMQHKVVEEQLHVAATMWTTQILKEPLQRVALDIALGVVRSISL
jgi:hypothetical protein